MSCGEAGVLSMLRSQRSLWRSASMAAAVLAALNLSAWLWALWLFHSQPILLGTALLAYGFGLRHAVDADHIAAIDNVTRKLVHEGKRPVAVGFFFALGHSTVVILAVAALGAAASTLTDHLTTLQRIGGWLGGTFSALFLLAIAVANGFVLHSVWRALRRLRLGAHHGSEDIDALLNRRGLLARLLQPLLRLIRSSWHMFPLGVLFGLGFDTASEVALLALAVAQAGNGMSLPALMVLPVLFAAGMSLLDTADGVLMLGAYSWAFIEPTRKLLYNLVMTLVTVLVAVLIAGTEALGLLQGSLRQSGSFWMTIARLNRDFSLLGPVIVGVFLLAWAGFVFLYRRQAAGKR